MLIAQHFGIGMCGAIKYMYWTVLWWSWGLVDRLRAMAAWAALATFRSGNPDSRDTCSQAATDMSSPPHVWHHGLALLRTRAKMQGR